MLGRKHVKDRYEIWYATSATFEATLVDAGQNAMVLERMHAGDIQGADDFILSNIKRDLDAVHALIHLAPDRDKSLAQSVIAGIAAKILDKLPTTNLAGSDYHEALRVSTAMNVRRQLEFFTKSQTPSTNTVTR